MSSDTMVTSSNQHTPRRWMSTRDNEIIKSLIGISTDTSPLKSAGDIGNSFSSLFQAKASSTASPTQTPLGSLPLSGSERNGQFASDIGEQVVSSQATDSQIGPMVPRSSNYMYGLLSPTDKGVPTYAVESDTSEDDEVPLVRRLTDKDGSSEDHPMNHMPALDDDDELDNLPLSLSRRSERLSKKADLTPVMAKSENWDYTKWKSPSGEMQPTAGALIPQGYRLHDDPQFPWVCPVRSCRTLYAKLCGLGSHFIITHRGWLFNDNEDGTISSVGKREGVGLRMSPAIVSRMPLDPSEPPMIEPSLPHYRKLVGANFTQPETNPRENEPDKGIRFRISSPYNICAPAPPKGDTGDTLWRYIQSHLVHTPLSPVPKYFRIPELLEYLYRIRDIEFNPHAQNKFKDTMDQDIAAMIIQACCDLKPWSLKTYPELSNVDISQNTLKRKIAESNSPRSAETKPLPERRSLRNMLKNERRKKKEIIRSNSNECPPHLPACKIQPTNKPKRFNVHSNGSTSAIDPAQMIELETWEIAPGRVRDGARDIIDNFAFSTAYLAQNQSVRICREISFQVITVKPGTIYSWETCAMYLRLCSVASGKLQVKIHGQEFLMGPNGMVMIKPGVDCTVMNKLYLDAVVHVTIVPSDLCE
ncbi:uncharacterized protein F4807DRAFT_471161 [Annulohypoxylon truncatum]|uniref:uncharacterized protein n=1 Tax=Annulohypoxylon truncatum TaxID=327061 RepID=UPI002008DE53|nr:uncharacterized protein F4807DRAFT_471161 [Annulohypoxylon truncatum]KAI1205304.1 hypothetical protein F4807DRAFT_471161 [Annulohypoxylon truncatum]